MLDLLHRLLNWKKLPQLQHLYTSYSNKGDSLKRLEARESRKACGHVTLRRQESSKGSAEGELSKGRK